MKLSHIPPSENVQDLRGLQTLEAFPNLPMPSEFLTGMVSGVCLGAALVCAVGIAACLASLLLSARRA